MENDQDLERQRKLIQIKEALYRFFYNIWPSVNKTINFFVYYTIKIIKGFFRIAMEQFRSK